MWDYIRKACARAATTGTTDEWAEGQYDKLPAWRSELVRRDVAIIDATGGVSSAQAAIKATSSIPILFVIGIDPVEIGMVSSLNRPGGNATGVSLYTTEVAAKLGDTQRACTRQQHFRSAGESGG